MLKSEKLEFGPAMSLNGSYNRLYKTNKPSWFKWLVAPWILLCWWSAVALFYMCGGFLFFAHSKRRKQLVEVERHRETLEAIKNKSPN
jgi:hypothetical protein